ncbi:MAG: hypothetical protein FJ033_00860 [Chloroflexi bacterium]|nr:hypothetical protein [Chloroflexota bacterium]
MIAIVEVGAKRAFASAVDWPGWTRAGRDEQGALEALAAYRSRYEPIAAAAGLALPGPISPDRWEVSERLAGAAGTDFGAPGASAEGDRRPTSRDEAARFAAILAAAWEAFDRISDAASETLRKGPRGGGRDRTAVVQHVLECDVGYYARRLGIRVKIPALDDRIAISEARAAMLSVLRQPSDGAPVAERGWSQRFAARYITWHVLDHAWEIEDRTERPG